MSWLAKTRCKKKIKYDFSVLKKSTFLLFWSVFIAIIPVFFQIFLDHSSLFNPEVSLSFTEMIYETVCKNDFRYINVSVLFILFIDNILLEKIRDNKLFDPLVFIWLFLTIIFWAVITAKSVEPNDDLFKLSLYTLFITFAIHTIYVAVKFTKKKIILVER